MTTAAHEHQHHDKGLPIAAHPMVLFGETDLYLCPLPRTSPPHNAQLILKVKLGKHGENVEERYRGDRDATSAPFYTVKPPAMRLPDLAPGASFVGDVHRDSHEDGGELLVGAVTVTVDTVVYDSRFGATTAGRSGGLTYLCFGEHGEWFAAHQMTSTPSFDQIVSVTILDEAVTRQPMQQACVMAVPAADDVFSRLQPHDAPKAAFVIHPGTRGEHTVRSRITVGEEIYFHRRFLAP